MPQQRSFASGRHPALSATASPATLPPVRGILALGAAHARRPAGTSSTTLLARVEGWLDAADRAVPEPADLRPERLVIDFGDADELRRALAKAPQGAGQRQPAGLAGASGAGHLPRQRAGAGQDRLPVPRPGQPVREHGRELARVEPVAEIFAEADRVMTPILGRPLTSFIFVRRQTTPRREAAEERLMQTAITQPAVLTLDTALFRLLAEYGFKPDMVMGHSLGEYAALVAAGVMPFADALEAAAARGAEMTKVSMADNGWMAAVMAPLDVVTQTLSEIDGYVVPANINSMQPMRDRRRQPGGGAGHRALHAEGLTRRSASR